MLLKKCCYFFPNNFKFCAVKKNQIYIYGTDGDTYFKVLLTEEYFKEMKIHLLEV